MSEKKTQEATGAELLERSRKEREEMNARFDALMQKMEEGNYGNQGYSRESEITMPGALFADFLNITSQVKGVLESMDKGLEQMIRTSELTQNNMAKLTIRLMEQHIQNVEDGNTSSQEALDQEDSEKKIKPIDKKKK